MHPIIWLTGLPCSGKTTIARELGEIVGAEVLDGDDLRSVLENKDFSEAARENHMYYVGEMASRISQYNNVITSLVSPLRDVRQKLKERYPNLVEIYVECPVSVCMERDVKGMWKMAKEGKIENFTGYNAVYEVPRGPGLVLETHRLSLEECVNQIVNKYFPNENK